MPDAPHHRPGGGFRNPWPDAQPTGFGGLLRWQLVDHLLGQAPTQLTPAQALAAYPSVPSSFDTPHAAPDAVTVTWVGHASFLVQLAGWNVLLDPVWSDRVSPVSFAGPKRLTPPGVPFDTLPPIDLVVLTHDHYDHLDAPTVRRIAERWPRAEWVAPLGVGARLRGFGARTVHERDWWDELTVGPIVLGCVPAQHFSGRGPTDRDRTLWCGWTLRPRDGTAAPRVLYAGDTALHPEFGAIARRFGPFALALLPIGAYAPRWFMRPVHCDPDDAVAAYAAIAAAQAPYAPPVFGAMHYGAFALADEPLDEPPRRTRAAWAAAGCDATRLWIPQRGETWRWEPTGGAPER